MNKFVEMPGGNMSFNMSFSAFAAVVLRYLIPLLLLQNSRPRTLELSGIITHQIYRPCTALYYLHHHSNLFPHVHFIRPHRRSPQ